MGLGPLALPALPLEQPAAALLARTLLPLDVSPAAQGPAAQPTPPLLQPVCALLAPLTMVMAASPAPMGAQALQAQPLALSASVWPTTTAAA